MRRFPRAVPRHPRQSIRIRLMEYRNAYHLFSSRYLLVMSRPLRQSILIRRIFRVSLTRTDWRLPIRSYLVLLPKT